MKKKYLLLLLLISYGLFSQDNKKIKSSSGFFEHSLPENEGVQSENILNFISEIESTVDELHSFIILKNNKNIASGWWSPYAPEIPHIMHSLSKSFTSSAIGIAVDEELLELNDRVISFFPEYNSNEIDENFKEMRIRDLLTMTTGQKNEINPSGKNQNNWIELFINAKLDFLPGNHFKYNSYATYMLSAILNKITGENLVDYLYPRLFLPLEIEKPKWEKCPKGITVGGWGLKIKTQDIAKFGQLYLQNGLWKGKQIISKDWIKMASSKQVDNSNSQWEIDWKQGYGFQFWKNRYNSYRGDGAFGQYCIVLPEHEMVVAITGSVKSMQAVLDIFWKEIFSKIQLDVMAEINFNAQQRLIKKLLTLKISPHNSKGLKIKPKVNLEKIYYINDNVFGIKSVQLNKKNNIYELKINSDSGSEKILIGKDKYIVGSLSKFNIIDNYNNGSLDYFKKSITSTPVASNGFWSEKNIYSLKILFLDNTASSNIDLSFDNNEIEIEISLKGVFGLKRKFKLSGGAI
tara:strand:+ start:4169 stop:5725 length:1557 start_codon:yes stop_codon:yes gene_type:complete